jgi:hypothetical protein
MIRKQELTRLPTSTDYPRFMRYARLVRRLSYNVNSPTHREIHHTVFDAIARTRMRMELLPNLTELEWIVNYGVVTDLATDVSMSVLFMHAGVKKFVVWLPFDWNVGVSDEVPAVGSGEPYIREIATRMPHLTHLDLRTYTAMHILQPSVTTSLFPHLFSLQTLILPNYHLTSSVLTTLSRLPHLGVIQFEYGSDQGDGDADDVQIVSPTLEEGAFPSLWDLSLTATLPDMTNFLNLDFAPVNLTSLYIDCPRKQSSKELQRFLVCVRDNCQLLKALYLELIWMDIRPREEDDRVRFETLEPLLGCLNLTYVPFLLPYNS